MLCIAASCAEWYSRGLIDNAYATIDPDGARTQQPFTAYCQRNGTDAYTIVRTYLSNVALHALLSIGLGSPFPV